MKSPYGRWSSQAFLAWRRPPPQPPSAAFSGGQAEYACFSCATEKSGCSARGPARYLVSWLRPSTSTPVCHTPNGSATTATAPSAFGNPHRVPYPLAPAASTTQNLPRFLAQLSLLFLFTSSPTHHPLSTNFPSYLPPTFRSPIPRQPSFLPSSIDQPSIPIRPPHRHEPASVYVRIQADEERRMIQ